MPIPTVIQAIEEQRARLLEHETATMRQMAERWLSVQNALQADMLDLAMYLDALHRKGETVSQARLMQMERYRQMVADARREQEQYSRWVADRTVADQRSLVAQGVTDAQGLIEAAGLDAKMALTFERINTSAVEFAAGFAADGTPLYELLKASYPESVVKLTEALLQGLASGKGPRETTARMAEDMAGNLDRALTIARTEQLRALRAGSLEQMKASKVVAGYIRRAQRSANVCAACLALDGQEQATEDVFASHPSCACFAQPTLKYGKTPSFPSGPEWFETQPESAQRQILGAAKFELYQEGKLDWSQVAKIHNDPVWGPTIRQRMVGEMKRSTGEMSVNELLKKAGSGKVSLTAEEIGRVRAFVAKAGFDPTRNVWVPKKYDGLVVDGVQLKAGELVSTGAIHYAKHVLTEHEWPEGTSYQDYIADLEQTILDENSRLLLNLYGQTETQLSVFAEATPGIWTIIQFRLNRKSWMTGYRFSKSSLDDFIQKAQKKTWIQK